MYKEKKEKIEDMLFKCADWLNHMTTVSIDDSYRKISIWETLNQIKAEINKENANDAESEN